MCNCPSCDWPIYTEFQVKMDCPRCSQAVECDGKVMPIYEHGPIVHDQPLKIADLKALLAERGRACWLALHSCNDPSQQWYDAWLKTIPSFGCLCGKHWDEITKASPPDFSSLEAFSQWAVDRHNDVNLKLGKPVYPY